MANETIDAYIGASQFGNAINPFDAVTDAEGDALGGNDTVDGLFWSFSPGVGTTGLFILGGSDIDATTVSDDDKLRGSLNGDTIYGGGRDGNGITLTNFSSLTDNDSIDGRDGDDLIVGGYGIDTLIGGAGDDVIWGDGAGDSIYGAFDDTIDGGADDDILHGEGGNDSIIAGTGDDVVLGEDGDDIIDVTSGNNTITGGNATSFVNGGIGGGEVSNGDDIFIFSSAAGFTNNMFTFSNNDIVTGDQDAIVVGASNFVRVKMVQDQAIVVEVDTDTTPGGNMNTYIINSFIIDSQEDADAFAASFFKDIGLNNAIDAGNLDMDAYVSGSYGTEHIDLVFGTDTDDTITFGHDLIESFGNDDTINSLGGNDTIYSGSGEDFIDASAGNDLVYAEAGNDIVQGKAGKDTLWGQDGNDLLIGGGDNDLLIGGIDDDQIFGQGGNDNLWAGSGNDLLIGGGDDDLLIASAGYGQGGDGNDTLDGGTGNDTLIAGHGGNTLRGGTDNDRLHGGAGGDVLDGGAGNDTIFMGSGADSVNGGAGADRFDFNGSTAASNLTNTDTIYGWDASDKLDISGMGSGGLHYKDGTLQSQVFTKLVYEHVGGETIITSNWGNSGRTYHPTHDFKLVLDGIHGLDGDGGGVDDLNTYDNLIGVAGGSTVICTELHRQGYMSDDIYEADTAFGANLSKTDPEVLLGYHFWAKPVVKLMQKSNIVTQLVRLPASCWANEMAYQIGAQEKGSMFGKTIMAVGIPACRIVGKLMNRRKTVQGNS